MDKINSTEYISCNIIEHGFDAQIKSINLCCRVSKDNDNKMVLIDNYRGEKVNWNEFFEITKKLRDYQKSGKTISCCEGCLYLKNDNWNPENYINTININNWIKCNANCIYCDRRYYLQHKEYKIYPIIKDLINKKLLRNPVDITIAGGEPTITKDFDKTLDILLKNKYSTIRVLTNAIKYNKNIEKGLKEGFVNILVSVDSGTEGTYYGIKRTNKHREVWKNLEKYSNVQKNPSLVKTKYIIIPGYNAKEHELYNFIQMNKKAGIKYSCIDLEINYFLKYMNNYDILDKIYKLYLFAKEEGNKVGIEVSAFDRMQIIIDKIETSKKI